MGDTHQQAFRSQQPRDDLTPGFLPRRNQQLVALRLQFRGGIFNILTSNSIHACGIGR
jgi:hypothetical protein